MRNFVTTYLKRPLQKIGVYKMIWVTFFALVSAFSKLRKFLQSKGTTASVLLYHRIATVTNDPTLLCVTPEQFEEHLQYLTARYEVIATKTLEQRIRNKALTGKELCITFDDGYQDNFTHGLPLLEKFKVPAAIFITTSNLGGRADFAWDKNYTQSDRATFLSPEEIRSLSKNPLITIGAHTHTHVNLTTLPEELVRSELSKSKSILEEIIGKPIETFAYPFGGQFDFNDETMRIAEDVGFASAYANNQLFVTNHSPLYAIPRFNVRNIHSDELALQIK